MKRSSGVIFSLVLLSLWGAVVPTAQAVLFYDDVSAAHNTSAPGGAYADSGWQWQGYFGVFMGTMISPQHFITAQHFGVAGSTFVHDDVFSGTGTTTYNINTSANGGLGYWDVAGTDLRIYQVTGGAFSSYAPLYTGSDEVGMQMVVTGRGGPRGAEVLVDSGSGPELKGWKTGTPDGVARWGLNEVSAIETSVVGELLGAEFNAMSGVDEAHLSLGDSGGAVFVNDGGTWKLAGINYAIDGYYDTNTVAGDGSTFDAALFDQGGLYVGSDSGGWTLIADEPTDIAGRQYASRISSSSGAIQSIVGVPEPGAGLLLLVTTAITSLRRRRK